MVTVLPTSGPIDVIKRAALGLRGNGKEQSR